MLKAYGIKVSQNMAEIEGRRLPLPQLAFGRNSNAAVTNGEWAGRNAVFKQVYASIISTLIPRAQLSKNGEFLSLVAGTRLTVI